MQRDHNASRASREMGNSCVNYASIGSARRVSGKWEASAASAWESESGASE